jgi:hypothetical protein
MDGDVNIDNQDSLMAAGKWRDEEYDKMIDAEADAVAEDAYWSMRAGGD